MASLQQLRAYIAAQSRLPSAGDQPCFDFVIGWAAMCGRDARAAFDLDGPSNPLRLALDGARFLDRARRAADRMAMPAVDDPDDGAIGLLNVVAPGPRSGFALALRAHGFWFLKSPRGVTAADVPFVEAWALGVER